jgi:hypothetical protein
MGINYNPRTVLNGLVLALDVANQKSYPTSGGTTWTDLSGNSNTGTLVNGVAQDVGFLNFDGTNDYVQLPITGTYTQISFDFWGFFDDPTLNMLSREESAFGDWNSNRVHFGTRWTNVSAGMHFNVNGTWQTTPPTNLRYGWNHYSLIYDTVSNQKLVYLNGILSSSNVTNGSMVLGDFKLGVATALGAYYRGYISNFKIYNRALTSAEVSQNYNAHNSRGNFLGSSLNPLSSPVQAQSLGVSAGNYYFKSGSMSSAQLLEYQPNYYESRPFCCVFRSPYRSTATTNKIDLSIPMGGLLVQRDALDLRGAVYWSTPITYTTVGGAGNNTADSGTGYAGSNARRVILGYGGGHGLYNTGQSQCNWGNAAGAIGAGYNGTCGTFPNDLVWGTGQSGNPFHSNESGTWSHWITWS